MPRDQATSRKVANALYRHTRRTVQASGLPVFEVNDVQQRGDSFGARLANAFADAFAAGYEHIIAVGSDCPRLHEVDWQSVAAQLNDGVPVLGPTSDTHGAYLIGLSRAQFDHEAFAALPWQSPDLLDTLADHLIGRAGQSPARLAAREDINNPRDLWALVHVAVSHLRALIARLRDALGYTVAYPPPVGRIASVDRAHIPSSRAPPAEGLLVLP